MPTPCPTCGGPTPCLLHPEEPTSTGGAPERILLDTQRKRRSLGDHEVEETAKRDPLAGTKVGEYLVVRRLGEGGMGVVYEGVQPLLQRRVAIKFLRRELAGTTDQIDALLSEARAANAARHRGLIDVFGFGELPGHGAYLVMEYLEGRPLDEVMRRGQLPPLEALRLLDEVLAALGAAHSRGIIHRDLKPSNVFLVAEHGGGSYVKVLDFGLAKRSETPYGMSPQTRSSVMVGTPEYMAPEQAMGQAVGPKTDLYALGVMAFEMLTGRLPFPEGSVIEVAMHHVNTPAPAPSTFDRSMTPGLDELVLSLLEKDPANRPDSAEAVRARIRVLTRELMSAQTNVAELRISPDPEPVAEHDEPELPASAQTAREHRPGKWLGLGAAVAVVVAVGVFLAVRPAATPSDALPDPLPSAQPEPPPLPELKPVIAPAGKARLEITLAKGWANVVVDGETIGRVPGGPFEVPAGKHTLELTNPARKSFRQELEVVAGETRQIQARLAE